MKTFSTIQHTHRWLLSILSPGSALILCSTLVSPTRRLMCMEMAQKQIKGGRRRQWLTSFAMKSCAHSVTELCDPLLNSSSWRNWRGSLKKNSFAQKTTTLPTSSSLSSVTTVRRTMWATTNTQVWWPLCKEMRQSRRLEPKPKNYQEMLFYPSCSMRQMDWLTATESLESCIRLNST